MNDEKRTIKVTSPFIYDGGKTSVVGKTLELPAKTAQMLVFNRQASYVDDTDDEGPTGAGRRTGRKDG